MSQTLSSPRARAPQSLLTVILVTGLLAGTLDAIAATTNFWIHGGTDAGRLWRAVASGALGPSARNGGTGIALLGLLFHYIIAFSWTTIYLLIYPKIPLLRKNILLSSLLYSLFVWLIMNLVVVPLSRIGKFPAWAPGRLLVDMLILTVVIGLPAALMARWYYSRK